MIEVENLTYTYPGAATPAVRGLSFRVRPGEILGFLGPSGAGKSTTQKVLIGLLKGYEGSVRVDGRELRDLGPACYERIGVGFELPNHYLRLTAVENLDFFRSLYSGPTDEPMALLEEVGLADAAHRRVGELSKGMRMRLNLARALLPRPRILFLDEPTSGLDPVNARRVKDIVLARRARGATVVLATHDMWVADELSDRVAFIVDGELKLVDAPRALKLRYGERKVEVETLEDGASARREFPLDGLDRNPEFLRALAGDVQTIHTRETTLESIFIRLTGRGLG